MSNHKAGWQDIMDAKHGAQIAVHEKTYGAKLGELKKEPTQEQLDADFEDRRAEGSLFSQQLDVLGRVDEYERLDQQKTLEEAGLQ